MNQPFTLNYRGDGVNQGQMNAYAVASSIFAFNDFLSIAAKEFYGEKIEINTTIQGFNHGSFNIDFMFCIGSLISTLFGCVNSPSEFLSTIKECLSIYIHLQGMPPKECVKDGDSYKIINHNGIVNVYNISSVTLASNEKIGETVEGFIKKPMELDEIDELNIKTDENNILQAINKKQASYFTKVDFSNPVNESIMEMSLTIESSVFKPGKWKFNDGRGSFFAEILDPSFLRRVENREEVFGKGDMLLAKVKITQAIVFSKPKISYQIVEVIKHIIPGSQKSIDYR